MSQGSVKRPNGCATLELLLPDNCCPAMRSAARGLDEAASVPPGYKLLEVPTEMMLSPAIVGLDVLIYWPEGRGTQRDDRDMAWHPGTTIRLDNDCVIMKYFANNSMTHSTVIRVQELSHLVSFFLSPIPHQLVCALAGRRCMANI